MDRIQELVEKITQAKEAYYNLSPIISDQIYDAWVDELKELDPNNQAITMVGATIPEGSVWPKIKHEIPMGSLNKVNSEQEFREWTNKFEVKEYLITWKLDGSSMELQYKDGNLVRAISRGDGLVGEDLTRNAKQISSIPHKLKIPMNINIRGEIIMKKSVFEEIYKRDYANPRNTAAGKIRDKKSGGADCKNLDFLGYDLYNKKFESMKEKFEYLDYLGLNTPPYLVGTIDQMITHFNTIDRDNLEYEIDGMVISINDVKSLDEAGSKNMRPEGQIAWKFASLMKESIALDIIWQVGLSGRACPVLIIKPVNIGGVEVSRVSLHNLSLFNELKLWKNCRVLISRRHDVIPYCEANLDLEPM
jgi:DNA ligase (NAD+)